MRITEQMIKERDKWLTIVSKATGVSERAIMGRSRVEEIAMARHLLIWALHSLRGYSYPMLAEMMGRTAATCTNSNNVIVYTHHTPEWREVIDELKAYNDEQKAH